MMLRAPAFMMILLHATPEAPTPATTIFMSSIRVLTIFREFSNDARTTTAVPSETTATEFLRIVRENDFFTSLEIAMHTRATPGVYAMDRSFRVFTGTLFWTSIRIVML